MIVFVVHFLTVRAVIGTDRGSSSTIGLMLVRADRSFTVRAATANGSNALMMLMCCRQQALQSTWNLERHRPQLQESGCTCLICAGFQI